VIEDDDQDNELPRPDVIGEFATRLRDQIGGNDWRERLARKHRCKVVDLRAEIVDSYWRARVMAIATVWLKDLTDDELDFRLLLDQRALEVARGSAEQRECAERLEWVHKELGRRGGIVVREPPGRKREVVAANQGFDGWAGPGYGGRR
jgi:hypothetical protein